MQHRVQHAHPRAQDRDDHDGILDLRARSLRKRRRDGDLDGPEVLQALERQELGEFADEFAEELRLCVYVAHERYAMPDERMC